MATSWYTEKSPKPVSFQRLARLIREGRIKETDLVRRAGSENWEVAESVVGLLHTAYRDAKADQEAKQAREARREEEALAVVRQQAAESEATAQRMRTNSRIKLVMGKILPTALGDRDHRRNMGGHDVRPYGLPLIRV